MKYNLKLAVNLKKFNGLLLYVHFNYIHNGAYRFISADKYPTPMVIIIEYKHTPQGAAQFIPS